MTGIVWSLAILFIAAWHKFTRAIRKLSRTEQHYLAASGGKRRFVLGIIDDMGVDEIPISKYC
jgi:hypothetical protein